MAKLPSTKRLSREDFPSDTPSWVMKIITPFNNLVETLYFALNKQLTFRDNFNCQVKEITFRTSSTYGNAPASANFKPLTFASTLNSQPDGLLIISLRQTNGVIITTATSADWSPGNGTIILNYVTGLTPSTEYKIRVLVF